MAPKRGRTSDIKNKSSKKKAKGGSNPFSGKQFVITGDFRDIGMKRSELSAHIESEGGTVVKAVSKKCDVALVGDNAGEKLAKAEDLGLEIWDEDKLKEVLDGNDDGDDMEDEEEEVEDESEEEKDEDDEDDDDDDAGGDYTIKGKKFCITGDLRGIGTRAQIKTMIESRGGTMASSVSKTCDIALVGDNAGSKLDKVEDLGLEQWGEDELNQALKASKGKATPKKTPSKLKAKSASKSTKKSASRSRSKSPAPKKGKGGKGGKGGAAVKGKQFVITGDFRDIGMKRSELSAKLESMGATVVKGVSKKCDIALVGDNAGDKLSKAEDLGLEIWDEDTLKEKLGL